MYEDVSADDLSQILLDSIIMYKKEPVYVASIAAKGCLVLKDINNKNAVGPNEVIKVNDPDISFTPVPLGFCNTKKETIYLSRRPSRQFKQGLSIKALHSFKIIDGQRKAVNIDKFWSVDLFNCIKGIYPSLEESIKLMEKEEKQSVAFSRSFAIDIDFNLFYKSQRVGMIDVTTGNYVFRKTYSYLKEVLDARIS